MPFPITPKEVFDNEYSDDFPFWYPVDQDKPNEFIPMPYETVSLWFLFTNEKDAEHFGYLIHKFSPNYQDKQMIAVSDTKRSIFSEVVPNSIQAVLIPRNGALQFFQEYEQFMAKYYGFD